MKRRVPVGSAQVSVFLNEAGEAAVLTDTDQTSASTIDFEHWQTVVFGFTPAE